MDITITRAALETLLADAAAHAPEEACGLLLGGGARIDRAHPVANVAADRARHFELDPRALIDAHRAARAGGPEVIGYYHSHPAGLDSPSAMDRAMAARDGRVWVIVGREGASFWRDGETGFAVLSWRVLER